MTDQAVLIVGVEYPAFLQHPGVLSVAQLEHALASGGASAIRQVSLGQGIEAAERQRLGQLLQAHAIACVAGDAPQVPTCLTHKHDAAHVLIAGARKTADLHYSYEFVLGSAEDRLCDHVTGQHVAAMLLIEAARQAVIASLDQQYPAAEGQRWGLILEQLNTRFHSYAFPVPTQLAVLIQQHSVAGARQIDVSLLIDIQQAGQPVCDMRFDVKLCDTATLGKIEERKARKLVGQLLHPADVAAPREDIALV